MHKEPQVDAPMVLLYSLAPAGTGAHFCFDWRRALPPHVVVRHVERPGHGMRMGEPALRDYETLVRTLAEEVAGDITSRRWNGGNFRYALYGHGVGACFAFGVAVRLRRLVGAAPARCLLSNGMPPHHDRPRRSTLPDRELLQSMHAAAERQARVFDREHVTSLLLPLYRADMAAFEGAGLDADRNPECPITAFATRGGTPSAEVAWDWQRYAPGKLSRVLLGDASGESVAFREPLHAA
ncbi:hypothetical protein HLB44_12545 [Aquincola sp. S2]|uniref:Thioesterase domain-containing protein n=1 Tax=Pseudaquabacterium terrae TaxID=2732868 RepID=A0ABX2EGQ2_9BURK|nr:thioesterase domain-containing protein [Aquabacterium terrae]NRF67814.1 hypothetical protein [Aquabacterium terrae]